MGRLTKRIDGVAHGAEGKSADSLTGKWCRGEFECTALVEKLAEYEDAEENGLLFRSPCKVGDTVYTFYKKCAGGMYVPAKPELRKCVVDNIKFGSDGNTVVAICKEPETIYFFKMEHFGKTFFPTKEEAGKALEERIILR